MIIIMDRLSESTNTCLNLSVIAISAEFLIGASLPRIGVGLVAAGEILKNR